MAFRLQAPTVTADMSSLSDVSQNKTFDEVVTIPAINSGETTTNFLSLTDVLFYPEKLQPGLSLLDIDGSTRWETAFSISSEAAIQANVRKARLVFYNTHPGFTFAPAASVSLANPNVHYNAVANHGYMTPTAPASPLGAVGGAFLGGSTPHRLGGGDATPGNPLARHSGPIDPTVTVADNRIKQVDISLGITDQMVTDYNLWVQQEQLKAQPSIYIPPPLPTQTWVAQITPEVSILNEGLLDAANEIDNSVNLVSQEAAASVETTVYSTPEVSKVSALAGGFDPTAHLDSFYSSGKTAGAAKVGGMIQFSLHGINLNAIMETVHTQSYGMKSATQSQNKATQYEDTSFQGSVDMQDLYAGSYESTWSQLAPIVEIPVQEITFESTEMEHHATIDLSFATLNPRKQRTYVKFELLDKFDQPAISRVFTVNIRDQIEPLLIPNVPPILSITDFVEGSASLEVTQADDMATEVGIYRMIADPENLTEATWTHIADSVQNSSEQAIKIDDVNLTGNVSPKVVIYEARCTGPLGGVCPTTTSKVMLGVPSSPVIKDLGGTAGECAIVPKQEGTSIEIDVFNLPSGVDSIFLKRDYINTSNRSDDWRKHPYIKVKGTNDTMAVTHSRSGKITFKDTNVVDRGIYRYYAQFNWKYGTPGKVGRTNSITDEYIEYRDPPEAPVVSYLSNMTVDTVADEPVVTFEFGASLTDEGINQMNDALGQTGTSAIFIEELKKDRSLLSNLVLCSITRKNLRTGDSYRWPFSPSGLFNDSRESNRLLQTQIPALETGTSYTYTVRVHIVNPEGFFREALMKMPASTQQIITNTDPNFIQVSAQKFAENFSQQSGMMRSPSAQQSFQEMSYDERVEASYVGISHVANAEIPVQYPLITKLTLSRDANVGSAANVLAWKATGNLNMIHVFQINVILEGGRKKFPLAGVSPNTSRSGNYQFRDQLFSHEIIPVSYEVFAVYTDQTSSPALKTKEIHGGTTMPLSLLNSALQSQARAVTGIDLLGENTNIEKFTALAAGQNSRLAGYSHSDYQQNPDPFNKDALALAKSQHGVRNNDYDQKITNAMNQKLGKKR